MSTTYPPLPFVPTHTVNGDCTSDCHREGCPETQIDKPKIDKDAITENQLKCIAFKVWKLDVKAPTDFNTRLRKNCDKWTATEVIAALEKGNDEIALNQLRHLQVL